MAFQIKDFASIVAGAINWMKSVTSKVNDFSIGSIARTLIEGPAAEMDELYQNIVIGLQEAIPVSVFNTFNFSALPAKAAFGIVRFSNSGTPATSPVTIPAGTIVQNPSTQVSYATDADATLAIGSTYVDVLVTATVTGESTNTGANTITSLPSPITGIASVANPIAFTNGADLELDDARKARFGDYISTLARGTNAALEYGAKTAKLVDVHGTITEYVAHAHVDEPYVADSTQPISLVNIYVHNGVSATSSDLVAAAQQVINGYYDSDNNPVMGWKAGGVKAVVSAASDQAVNVTGTLTTSAGYDHPTVVAQAIAAVQAYIASLDIGDDVILAAMIAAIKDIPGVYNIVLSSPSADVSISTSQKAVPGTVTIS